MFQREFIIRSLIRTVAATSERFHVTPFQDGHQLDRGRVARPRRCKDGDCLGGSVGDLGCAKMGDWFGGEEPMRCSRLLQPAAVLLPLRLYTEQLHNSWPLSARTSWGQINKRLQRIRRPCRLDHLPPAKLGFLSTWRPLPTRLSSVCLRLDSVIYTSCAATCYRILPDDHCLRSDVDHVRCPDRPVCSTRASDLLRVRTVRVYKRYVRGERSSADRRVLMRRVAFCYLCRCSRQPINCDECIGP